MKTTYDLPVVTSQGIREAACRFCGQMIFWVTVARRGVGKPAATLPFNRRPLGARREDYSGYTIEYWSSAELHPKTCPRRPVNTRGY